MSSALESELSGLGSSPGQGHFSKNDFFLVKPNKILALNLATYPSFSLKSAGNSSSKKPKI